MVRSTDLPRPDSGSGSRWGTSRPLHTPPQFRLPNGHSDRSANASANFAIRTLWCPTSPALWELALHAARFGRTSGYSHQPSCQCDVSVALRAGNCQDPSGRRTQSAPAHARVVPVRAAEGPTGGRRPPRSRGLLPDLPAPHQAQDVGPRARGAGVLVDPGAVGPALAGIALASRVAPPRLRHRPTGAGGDRRRRRTHAQPCPLPPCGGAKPLVFCPKCRLLEPALAGAQKPAVSSSRLNGDGSCSGVPKGWGPSTRV